MMINTSKIKSLGVAALLLSATAADADPIRGRIELSYGNLTSPTDSIQAILGFGEYTELRGNLRLMWQNRWDDWDVEVHYNIAGQSGDGVALAALASGGAPAGPPRTLFDLTETVSSSATHTVVHTIDRLSLGYSSPSVVIRVGRQALTWGSGTVFHPMDLVAPFSPEATDTTFKPGVDLIYLQWLMNDGSDLQFIIVPRADTQGGRPTVDASTFAAQLQTTIGELEAKFVLAKDHGDTTAAIGLSGALGGAGWNAEIVPTWLASGETAVSGIANISMGTTILGRSTVLFGEYYHNGFGVTGSGIASDTLPTELSDRLARGQVFGIGRNYLAVGGNMGVSPLMNVSVSGLFNLDDSSQFYVGQADWSLGDNTNLVLGFQLPVGDSGTEYGGIPVSGTGAPYASPQSRAYVQFKQYF